jgi:hypothetical protein
MIQRRQDTTKCSRLVVAASDGGPNLAAVIFLGICDGSEDVEMIEGGFFGFMGTS